jgi:hypothetical protein
MSRIIIITLLSLSSLLWIGYNALELFQRGVDLNPGVVFGPSDQEIYILNNPANSNLLEMPFQLNEEQSHFLNSAAQQVRVPIARVFFSDKKPSVLFQTKGTWTVESAKKLLHEMKTGSIWKVGTFGKYTWGPYSVQIDKDYLFLWKGEKNELIKKENLPFDALCNYAVIEYVNGKAYSNDYYLSEKANYQYSKSESKYFETERVNDSELFSAYIPRSIENYHFYERGFMSQTDELFAKGPMKDWVNSGVLTVDFQSSPILISDFLSGNDPINVLSQQMNTSLLNTEDQTFSSKGLCLDWRSKGAKKYHYRLIDNMIFIGLEKEGLDQFCGQVKLGNVMSTSPMLMETIFEKVPQQVHEREWKGKEVLTIVNYGHYQILSKKIQKYLQNEAKSQLSGTLQLAGASLVQDFVTIPKSNSALVTNDNNEILIYYSSVLRKKISLDEAIVGSVSTIRIKDKEVFLITTKNQVLLLDEKGEHVHGSPIKAESTNILPVKSYTLNGETKLILSHPRAMLSFYESNGKKSGNYEASIAEFACEPIVWNSQNKPFLGLRSGTEFEMIDLIKIKSHRKFALPIAASSIFGSEGLQFYHLSEGKIIRTNQKGEIHILDQEKVLRLFKSNKDQYLAIITSKGIEIMDGNESTVLKIPLENTVDIESWTSAIYKNEFYFATWNGLDNSLRVYKNQSELSIGNAKGKLKLDFHIDDFGMLKICSPLEDFLMMYPILP